MAFAALGSSTRVHLVSAGFAFALLSTVAPLARAAPPAAVDDETRAAARQLGTEGVNAYQEGDYARASERLERAFQLLEAPSLGRWSARALEKKGQLVKAAERYVKTSRLPAQTGGDAEVQERAKVDAAAELEALRPRIPNLVIQLEGATPEETSVTVNGAPIKAALIGTSRPTDPGEVEIVARNGGQEVRQKLRLEEGQTRTATLNLQTGEASDVVSEPEEQPGATATAETSDAPAAPSRWQIPVGWTTLGVGVAGLAAGGVTAGLAAGQYDAASLGCNDNVCPPGSEGQVSSYNTLRLVSTVGFIAGGVLAAAGITLLVTAPRRPESAYIAPLIGFGTLGVEGRF